VWYTQLRHATQEYLKAFCAIFTQSKNCGITIASHYYAAARKQKRNGVSAQSMLMAAQATMEYVCHR
jgi:hypothetical protein